MNNPFLETIDSEKSQRIARLVKAARNLGAKTLPEIANKTGIDLATIELSLNAEESALQVADAISIISSSLAEEHRKRSQEFPSTDDWFMEHVEMLSRNNQDGTDPHGCPICFPLENLVELFAGQRVFHRGRQQYATVVNDHFGRRGSKVDVEIEHDDRRIIIATPRHMLFPR